ncbi:MAG TPA: hypothetical protein DIW45_05245, partial [Erythrobacter sp.]|nr:hypothetical protein [Erythrobacter sp.]
MRACLAAIVPSQKPLNFLVRDGDSIRLAGKNGFRPGGTCLHPRICCAAGGSCRCSSRSCSTRSTTTST